MNNVAKEGLEEALSRQLRSTRERLGAMLGRQGEALSPWVLRRTLRELQNVADPAVSDVEGGRRAAGVAGWYARATPEQRRDCWLLMSDQFPPDPSAIETARAAYDAARGTLRSSWGSTLPSARQPSARLAAKAWRLSASPIFR